MTNTAGRTPREAKRDLFFLPAVLATIVPFTSFLSENAKEPIDLATVAYYCVIGIVIFAVLPLIFLPFGRRAAGRASFVLSAFILSATSFALLKKSSGLTDWTLIEVHAASVVAAMIIAWFLSRYEIIWRAWLAALAVTIVVSAVTYGWVQSQMKDVANKQEEIAKDDEKPLSSQLKNPRNVYYLIPDAYGSRHALELGLKLDNTNFIDYLKDENFVVDENTYSNYVGTQFSISATLDMDFVIDDKTEDAWALGDYYRAALNGKNRVFAKFQELGYFVAKLNYANSCVKGAFVDFCHGNDRGTFKVDVGLTELELNLLRLTAIHDLIMEHFPYVFQRHLQVKDFNQYHDMIRLIRSDKPSFYFGHVLLPHPPYRFSANCGKPKEIQTAFNEGAWTKHGAELYIDAVKCTNIQLRAVIKTIDRIDPDAIVIIQADHGPAFTVDWAKPIDAWTDEQVAERFGTLSAFRLPKECQSLHYDGISPINDFEMIFACLEGREPHYKEDRVYIATFNKDHPQAGKLWRYR